MLACSRNQCYSFHNVLRSETLPDLGPYPNEEALREGVERRRGKPISDDAWISWERLEVIEGALDKGLREEQESYLLSLLSEASETMKTVEEKPQASEQSEEVLDVSVGSREKKRARAFAAYSTRILNAREDVRSFRADYLEGRVLRVEEAFEFLESPALRLFSADFLKSIEIPILGHEARIVSARSSPFGDVPDHQILVDFGASGIRAVARYAPHWVKETNYDIPTVRVCGYKDPQQQQQPEPPLGKWPLEYPGKFGVKAEVYVWPQTVLDDLRHRSLNLSKTLGWEVGEVAWLLLTGQAPYLLNPLKIRLNYTPLKPATVHMEIAAWLPAETVAEKLRDMQREILTVGVGKPSERGLDVCIFVEENIQDAEPESVWPSLCRKWNKTHPDKRYKDHQGLRQAYSRNMPTVIQEYKPPRPSSEARKQNREFMEQFPLPPEE